MWLLVLSLLVLLGGAVVAARGWRGKRIDDHPVCAKCRFDLSGAAASHTKCPECGALLGIPGSVRTGNVLRSGVAMAVGSWMLVLGGVGVWSETGQGIASKPEWLLEFETGYAQPPSSNAVIDELTSRLRAATLNNARARRLLDKALAIQADPVREWSEAWGRYIEAAIRGGIATPAEALAYVRNGYEFDLITNDRDYAFRWWIAMVQAQPVRGASKELPFLSWSGSTFTASVGSWPLPLEPASMRAFGAGVRTPGVPWLADQSFWLDLDPGIHTVQVQCGLVGTFPGSPDSGTISVPLSRTVSLNVNAPEITRMRAPSQAAYIASLISIKVLALDAQRSLVTGTVRIDAYAPMALAFSIYLRSGGQEWLMGSVFTEKGRKRWQAFIVAAPGLTADRVDVVLRHDWNSWMPHDSAPDRVWYGEIVIPDVRLVRLSR